MKKTKIPQTDSIRELAEFFDTHSLEEYEDQLEEVTEPVFNLKRKYEVELTTKQALAVKAAARAAGLGEKALISRWVAEKLAG